MKWSLRIGTIAGTAVRVHVTFLLLLAWIWLMHYRIGGTQAAVSGVAFVLAVFGCVILHEFGHIAVARRYGIRTPDITLLPIGGLARLERMPKEPRQELAIAIAGPMVNVAIALVVVVVLGQLGDLEAMAQPQDPRTDFLVRLAGVNLFLFLFNLIPALPMDGGRVLRALLAMRLSWTQSTRIAAAIGQSIAFAMGLAGLVFNPWLLVIAVFIYLAATSESQDAEIEDLSGTFSLRDVMISEFEVLSPSSTVAEAVDRLLATTQSDFPIVAEDGGLKGVLMRDGLIAGLREYGSEASVQQFMRTDVPQVVQTASVAEALARMQDAAAPLVAIVDVGGRVVGMIDHRTVGEMLLVHSAAAGHFPFLPGARRKTGTRELAS